VEAFFFLESKQFSIVKLSGYISSGYIASLGSNYNGCYSLKEFVKRLVKLDNDGPKMLWVRNRTMQHACLVFSGAPIDFILVCLGNLFTLVKNLE